MEIKTVLITGLYGSPVLIGGLFFEKNPIFMGILMFVGMVFLGVKLKSDLETQKARRGHVGYGDLARGYS